MEIIYRAVDGREFRSAYECVEHEKSHCMFLMYDRNGRVNNPNDSNIVFFKDDDLVSAKDNFIKVCENYDVTTEGIERYSNYTLYLWSGEVMQWVPIKSDDLGAIREFVEDKDR